MTIEGIYIEEAQNLATELNRNLNHVQSAILEQMRGSAPSGLQETAVRRAADSTFRRISIEIQDVLGGIAVATL